jgi:hypothetical protein
MTSQFEAKFTTFQISVFLQLKHNASSFEYAGYGLAEAIVVTSFYITLGITSGPCPQEGWDLRF